MYASLCDFVCIALLLPFVLEFCPFFFVFNSFSCFLSLVDLFSGLVTPFFLFLILFIFYIFLFFILITLLYFIYLFFLSFFVSFFFSPISSEPCGQQGLGALAGCQACAAEVGEPSSGYWSTRELLAPCNIKWQKLSKRSPSQH